MIGFKVNFKVFETEINNEAEKSLNFLNKQLKALFIETFNLIQIRTPVDNGALRSEWELLKLYVSAYNEWEFVNELPYASRIEFESYSSKAPEGMARISIEELVQKLQELQRTF